VRRPNRRNIHICMLIFAFADIANDSNNQQYAVAQLVRLVISSRHCTGSIDILFVCITTQSLIKSCRIVVVTLPVSCVAVSAQVM
jgi:hypothetical protein